MVSDMQLEDKAGIALFGADRVSGNQFVMPKGRAASK